MRFQVPQFINVEDKIFGPLTIKQFIYLAGGAGTAYMLFKFLPIYISIFLVVPVIGLALALAFYKVNNKPFIGVVESAFKFSRGAKLFIWKKEPRKINVKEKEPTEGSESLLYVPKLSDSKLKDLTWSLDIKENVNPGTRETMGKK